MDLVGFGRIWSDSVGFGRILISGKFGRIGRNWSDLVGIASGRGPLLVFSQYHNALFLHTSLLYIYLA